MDQLRHDSNDIIIKERMPALCDIIIEGRISKKVPYVNIFQGKYGVSTKCKLLIFDKKLPKMHAEQVIHFDDITSVKNSTKSIYQFEIYLKTSKQPIIILTREYGRESWMKPMIVILEEKDRKRKAYEALLKEIYTDCIAQFYAIDLNQRFLFRKVAMNLSWQSYITCKHMHNQTRLNSERYPEIMHVDAKTNVCYVRDVNIAFSMRQSQEMNRLNNSLHYSIRMWIKWNTHSQTHLLPIIYGYESPITYNLQTNQLGVSMIDMNSGTHEFLPIQYVSDNRLDLTQWNFIVVSSTCPKSKTLRSNMYYIGYLDPSDSDIHKEVKVKYIGCVQYQPTNRNTFEGINSYCGQLAMFQFHPKALSDVNDKMSTIYQMTKSEIQLNWKIKETELVQNILRRYVKMNTLVQLVMCFCYQFDYSEQKLDNISNPYKDKKLTGLNMFQKIDNALGIYYKFMKRTDYFHSNNGKGKFLQFCEENCMEQDNIEDDLGDDVELEDCMYLEFDDNFPIESFITDNDQRKQKMFEIIKYCWKNNQPPCI